MMGKNDIGFGWDIVPAVTAGYGRRRMFRVFAQEAGDVARIKPAGQDESNDRRGQDEKDIHQRFAFSESEKKYILSHAKWKL
jgi:hypothetical protein